MLRVPELKPGEEGFEPEDAFPNRSGRYPVIHSLTLPEREGENTQVAAMSPDSANEPDRGERDNVRFPESGHMEESRIRAILNHAVVKDAVTELHREDDEQMTALAQYDGMRICDIKTDHERFLKSQAAKYDAMFKTEAQRSLFRTMTGGYFQQSRDRAKRLQMSKVMRFRERVVERQNEEFMERALREEVVFDDIALTGYRDLLFYNLENLLAELPESERKVKMDAAGRTLYCNIMERRLELSPDRLQSMLDAKEVRRVLGDSLWKEYAARAKAAMRDDELKAAAKEWVDHGHDPREAKRLLGTLAVEKKEKEAAWRYYADFRSRAAGRDCFARITAFGRAWTTLKENGYRVDAIPEHIRRNDPGEYAFLCRCLEKRENCGGRSWPVQWAVMQSFLKEFSLRDCLETLREEKACHDWIDMAGGPDSPFWALSLRLLAGKMTEEDERLLQDIRLAWGEGRDNAFMDRFVRERHRGDGMGELDVLKIVRELEAEEREKARKTAHL